MDLSEINITKPPDIDNIQWYLAKMFENVFSRIPTNSYMRFLLIKMLTIFRSIFGFELCHENQKKNKENKKEKVRKSVKNKRKYYAMPVNFID